MELGKRALGIPNSKLTALRSCQRTWLLATSAMCHFGSGLFLASGQERIAMIPGREAGSRQLEEATLPHPQIFHWGAASSRVEFLRGSWMTLPRFPLLFWKVVSASGPGWLLFVLLAFGLNLCCRLSRAGGSTNKNFSGLPYTTVANRTPLPPAMIMKTITLLLH